MNYCNSLIKPFSLLLPLTATAKVAKRLANHSGHFVSIFLLSMGLSSLSLANDFGVADWGMSIEEVKALETRPNLTPFGADGYLIFSVAIKGIDHSRLIYQFEDGVLTEGRFLFQPMNKGDFNRALEQYYTVRSFISAQYGQPYSDETLYKKPAMASSQVTGEDLAADNVILKTAWRSESSSLQHQLAWYKNQPHHQIHYRPVTP
ncbi:hypothetical protein [Reinekea thalattae]|uniref:Uncharacterized protein n=1 Tax=Reinekea thalattae TaxID=2593301 RepID=A0A5C8Z854_9GAMM|nr:hypothetical protein [Reinekea thalattae]TXR53418.1 hypothetical protein FME95_02285 [Reinekea thalattae]